MKAVILDGSREDDSTLRIARDIIENMLRKNQCETDSFILRDTRIGYCSGYFCCWLKTPGMCVMNDAGRDIARSEAKSDFWIFLTPITFGGYSSELKKAIDRSIHFILPYFMKVNGEVHHRPRYDSRPRLMVFGSTERPDPDGEEIFKELVYRNSINFHCSHNSCKVLARDAGRDKIGDAVKEAFGIFGFV